SFPPKPPSIAAQAQFLRRWCAEFSADAMEEDACAVCACLHPRQELRQCSYDSMNLSVLERPGEGVTRLERLNDDDPLDGELSGPILYMPSVSDIDGQRSLLCCVSCFRSLSRGQLPILSLANGRWVGDVPAVLNSLTYGEELLIARFRRNYCIAHVSGGQQKLKANAIVFEQPVLRVYD
ncbi:hypothetical protein FKP32DRAFT_1544844, partial [Trametes sanguinea]